MTSNGGFILGRVYWEDEPSRVREVVSICSRCRRTFDGRNAKTVHDVAIVSPKGCGHVQHWEHPERTACGVDATGPDWWWRA